MSNGSEIGGVIGGAIGAYFGGADGARYGYAIGSAIGGYVDPQRNYGPRLTDASSQTSTVGGVIPFGFGIFTTAGNLIWADDLKEHKKSERAGKGGGQKNITYTYTRSYAIGVCEGIVFRYMWIKRNGKLVYAHDPAALGVAMGWTGAQISDLAAASNKFMERCRIHYGTKDQMPDATITAVEGVGNVSAFRDLSYITVRDDDLTNTSGAVPQYEFCVDATEPEAYLTSQPYAQLVKEAVQNRPAVAGGSLRTILKAADVEPDLVLNSPGVVGGLLYIFNPPDLKPDETTLEPGVQGGTMKSPTEGHVFDSVTFAPAVVSGMMYNSPLGRYSDPTTIQPAVIGGTLNVP